MDKHGVPGMDEHGVLGMNEHQDEICGKSERQRSEVGNHTPPQRWCEQYQA